MKQLPCLAEPIYRTMYYSINAHLFSFIINRAHCFTWYKRVASCKRLAILAILTITTINCFGKSNVKYWIQFKNKSGTEFSIEKPHEFLSHRAITRREAQHIQITEEDLPVSKIYIDSLLNYDIDILGTSKWLNGAIISTESDFDISKLINLNFVDTIELTYEALQTRSTTGKFDDLPASETEICNESSCQLALHNGQLLHEDGYTGRGMLIAVIDGGFKGVENLPSFARLRDENRIIAQRDFVDPSTKNRWSDNHGMQVLSILTGRIPNTYIGSAPDASYILCKTEDEKSEYPVEADYWILAAEYADSFGVDIINTSLGYSDFQNSSMSYTYDKLDGHTLRISRAANIAATKGILVVNSAGNSRKGSSKKILAPADAENVITVGSVNTDSTHTDYSAFGPNAIGAIKPNVMSIGYQTALQSPNGNLAYANGTSYATPIISGLAACLWQALPTKTAFEIKELIEKSSNNVSAPDTIVGFGIPDFWKAYTSSTYTKNKLTAEPSITIYPNPATDYVIISSTINNEFQIKLSTIDGKIVTPNTHSINNNSFYLSTSHLPKGIYILQLYSTSQRWSRKLIIE